MFVVCEVVLGNCLYVDKNIRRANPRLDGTLANGEMKSVSINSHRLSILIFQDARYATVMHKKGEIPWQIIGIFQTG